MNKDTLIRDWLEGNISPEQLENFRKDPEYREAIHDLEQIITSSSKLAPPKGKSKAQAWNDFSAMLGETEQPVTKKPAKMVPFSTYRKVGIAATVALIILVYFLIPRSNVIRSGPGEQLTHNLPDGSKVHLNAATNIEYNASKWETARVVQLTGEAYFEVTPGKTFTVKTNAGNIEVLGTRFNTYAREQELKVACFEGSVKVFSDRRSEVVLKKGEYTALDNERWEAPTNFDTAKTATWRSGEFYYNNTPLAEVIAELERQFNIEINTAQAEKRYYTGYFNNRDLEEALKLVFLPMSLNYDREGAIITIQ